MNDEVIKECMVYCEEEIGFIVFGVEEGVCLWWDFVIFGIEEVWRWERGEDVE